MPKMATELNINKNPSLNEGQLWKTFNSFSDNDDDKYDDEIDDLTEDNNETMKLRREDMPLFGICPSRDEVYFVVCEYCKLVFKPQALVHHIERRHSNHLTSNTSKRIIKEPITANGNNNLSIDNELKSDAKLLTANNSVVFKSIKSNRIESDEKRVNNNNNSITGPNTVLPVVLEPTGPGPGPGVDTNYVPNTDQSQSELPITKPNAKKKSSKKSVIPSQRKLLPCKDREYDANKHCGVATPDIDKPCTRSLTCKSHSLTLRRAVKGRTKNFDELLAEHRTAKEDAMRAQGIEVKPTKKALLKQQRQQQLLLKQQKLDNNTRLNDTPVFNRPQPTLFPETEFKSPDYSNVNSILTIPPSITTITSPPVSTIVTQRTQHSHTSDSVSVSYHHPRPATLCNYTVRNIPHYQTLYNHSWDLTIAAFNNAFFESATKSAYGTGNSISSTNVNISPSSIISPKGQSVRYNQHPALKKLCIELTPLEFQLQPQSDPYNFPDATTSSSSSYSTSYTYIKPKTAVSKNVPSNVPSNIPSNASVSPSANRKKKNDNAKIVGDDHVSSLLNNGQLSQQCLNRKSPAKRTGNSKKVNHVNPVNTSANNYQMNTISNTISHEQQNFHPSGTSLVNYIPSRSLNDILSNSIDTNTSLDSSSILLNGSVLNNKNHITLGKQNKAIDKSTTLTSNKSFNKGSTSTTIPSSTLSPQTKTIHKSMPLLFSNQSQHNQQQTTMFIKSSPQSSQKQLLSTTLPSKFLSKSDDFPT